jgi:hypothetical protein
MVKHKITPADLMPMEEYAMVRAARRKAIMELKASRRVTCGPDATFYFENYDTMWHQVHEMLHVERGGAAQVADELAAFNPLIPDGRELVATVMFEVPDESRRQKLLASLGGVEQTFTLDIDGESIKGTAEDDVDRTSADGKASSVQFIHFPFTDAQVTKFRAPGMRAVLGIGHPQYAHMVVLPENIRVALAEDFD